MGVKLPNYVSPPPAIASVPIRTAMFDGDMSTLGNLTRTWMLFFQSIGGVNGTPGNPGAAGGTGATGAAGGAYLPIDPRAHGGVGDGATDDSAAISLAIAQGGLYLQSGVVFAYTWAGVSAAFAAITGTKFLIDGGGTLRLLSGSSSALTFTGSVHMILRDVVIDGNSACGMNPTIAAATGGYLHCVGVLVINGTAGQYAISLSNFVMCVFDRVDVSAASPTALTASGTSTYNAINCNGIADNVGF